MEDVKDAVRYGEDFAVELLITSQNPPPPCSTCRQTRILFGEFDDVLHPHSIAGTGCKQERGHAALGGWKAPRPQSGVSSVGIHGLVTWPW